METGHPWTNNPNSDDGNTPLDDDEAQGLIPSHVTCALNTRRPGSQTPKSMRSRRAFITSWSVSTHGLTETAGTLGSPRIYCVRSGGVPLSRGEAGRTSPKAGLRASRTSTPCAVRIAATSNGFRNSSGARQGRQLTVSLVSPSPHGRTRMIVFPERRDVGLKAATASPKVETVPMFGRSRPSRTR